MRKSIIDILFHAEDFVSGEELSEQLGVSRAAVWKHIKEIRAEGGEIEAHTRRGYRLTKLPDLLKPEYVSLYEEMPGVNYVWMDEIDSTNEEAKRAGRDGAPAKSVFIAEHQGRAKGRLGRGWDSQRGTSIEMTVLLRPQFTPEKAPAITFAAALGLLRAVRRVCGVQALIKWPNDIVYEGKKLCGILTEMSSDIDHVEYIVCGMGLNVNQQDFPDEVRKRAVSLRMATGKELNRQQLCAALTNDVFAYCERYINEGIGSVFDEYCENSAIIGKEIRIVCANETLNGVCEGFCEDGAVIVRVGQETRIFRAGEVSVRGMADYI
ncbi:MAG: biotin--[acetyl-CoA-carboxylase] ligase [Christensenella sp.]|uniref:biotin--[acetyl-CoA-carboxylase] ligase n=1 Tax=Christensenella sp. TaxID=1935934 RepID=UPI002B1ED517|nr:biotin--[acetyl-CoA-carboxylase] ligase [Christensenella sp.]MEA5002774.1 biotin--[acetyl-CoA-carboxylase] ligase [Christensenella sp.]